MDRGRLRKALGAVEGSGAAGRGGRRGRGQRHHYGRGEEAGACREERGQALRAPELLEGE